MENSSQDDRSEEKSMTKEEKERAEQANQVYCEACEEKGIKVSSWKNFDAWNEFVDGAVSETVLTDKAEVELAEFAKRFGKFLVIEKEDPTRSDDTEKKERVKRANRIYRRLCEAAGLTFCFFNNFATWSDYVEGKISESEFLEESNLEVEKMIREST
jgi:hypothetical protein